MRFRTVTLGCKVNQYETQYVRTALLANGYEETPQGSEATADLVVVNTCSVTAESDAKSRKAISRVVHQSPQAAVYVMGCFASKSPDEASALPGVSAVLSDKRRL
ncbi:MAG: tRNA (N(6)-L-threonylcarbamoyladenosine(37)-C(2))-methylthiotransferase MtaB, partial [Planctomycetia bacterium]|nr:tRNA (N(6)-L-threonylcarbamoyladenosine(37)-C(2))-methylthiotransferase MtaB [Planctomycetia bacterium]